MRLYLVIDTTNENRQYVLESAAKYTADELIKALGTHPLDAGLEDETTDAEQGGLRVVGEIECVVLRRQPEAPDSPLDVML